VNMPHLALNCWKYRLYPCAFDNPETAARTQLGWTQYPLHVPVSETALLLMHLWNHGYPGGLDPGSIQIRFPDPPRALMIA